MTARFVLVKTWRVGNRTCTLSVPWRGPERALSAVVEWEPDVPSRLSQEELAQYRTGRNAALAEASSKLGISCVVFE